MRTRSARGRGPFRLVVLAIVLGALSLLPAAPGFADPGTPGLETPATAVDRTGDERPVLGEGEGQVIGEEEDPLGTVEGGEGLPESMGASGGAADGGDVEILPFTGMVAALVIGAGLVALLLGLMARAAAERLRRA